MKALKYICRHLAVVLSLFYVVLFLIDRINNAMEFINNDITKFLLLILAVLSVFNAYTSIIDDRRRRARSRKGGSRNA